MKLVIDYIPKKFKPYARGHYQNDEGYWLIFNDSVILDGERHTAKRYQNLLATYAKTQKF